MEVASRVIFTTFAVAVGHDWGEVGFEFGVFDVDAAVVGVERAVARHAGGADAVESVDAKFGANE